MHLYFLFCQESAGCTWVTAVLATYLVAKGANEGDGDGEHSGGEVVGAGDEPHPGAGQVEPALQRRHVHIVDSVHNKT